MQPASKRINTFTRIRRHHPIYGMVTESSTNPAEWLQNHFLKRKDIPRKQKIYSHTVKWTKYISILLLWYDPIRSAENVVFSAMVAE